MKKILPLIVICLLAVIAFWPKKEPLAVKEQATAQDATTPSKSAPNPSPVNRPQWKPLSEAKFELSQKDKEAQKKFLITERDYGQIPAIKEDANEATKGVIEAYKTGTHPERLSPMIKAPAFNYDAFANDKEFRKNYLAQSVPARVNQVKKPGIGVPQLKRIGPSDIYIIQGKSIELSTESPSGSVVTYTTYDAGVFENQLTSITVVADSSGVATVEYTPTTGVIAGVNIMAGSPMASLNARWRLQVTLPNQ
jgi:hypothetical protein